MSGVAISCGCVTTDLPPRPINPAWIRGGDPVARATELWRSYDKLSCTWVWECTPGQFEWHYTIDETIHILEGAVILDDGVSPPRRLGPGDIVFFPAGAVVHWTVLQTVRKVAFFRRHVPKPLAMLMRFAVKTMKRLRGSATASAGEGPKVATPAVATTEALGV